MKQTAYTPAATSHALAGSETSSLWRRLLADSAAAWRLPERVIVIILLAPFVVALAGAGTALFGKEAYKWFTGEDRFAETAQVVLYAGSLLMCLAVIRRYAQRSEPLIAGLFAVLACGLIFMVGEELSWGQRMFGWQTPQSLAENNKQAETNLHNIYGVGSTFKWIQMVVGAYGVFLPLIALHPALRAKFGKLLSAVVPHYTLVIYFLPMFIWRGYRNLFEPPDWLYFAVAEYNEVIELILSLGFFLFLLYQLRHLRKPTSRNA